MRLGVWAVAGAVLIPAGCSTPEQLGGAGATCLLFTDCDPRFVCIKNVCTKDLSGLVHIEPVPMDGSADGLAEGSSGYPEGAPGYGDGPTESSYSTSEGGMPQPEAGGSPESGPPPQVEASTEATTPPVPEAGRPDALAPETSTMPAEAGE